jgi:hypothetical protein
VRPGLRLECFDNGETVVKGSRDPETDLARALLAKGCGTVMVLDANTLNCRYREGPKLREVEAHMGLYS